MQALVGSSTPACNHCGVSQTRSSTSSSTSFFSIFLIYAMRETTVDYNESPLCSLACVDSFKCPPCLPQSSDINGMLLDKKSPVAGSYIPVSTHKDGEKVTQWTVPLFRNPWNFVLFFFRGVWNNFSLIPRDFSLLGGVCTATTRSMETQAAVQFLLIAVAFQATQRAHGLQIATRYCLGVGGQHDRPCPGQKQMWLVERWMWGDKKWRGTGAEKLQVVPSSKAFFPCRGLSLFSSQPAGWQINKFLDQPWTWLCYRFWWM